MTRPYRGATYRIRIERVAAFPEGREAEVVLDGKPLPSAMVPPPGAPGGEHEVVVRCG